MRPSLFPSDDELPTWLHTLLCMGVVSPMWGFFLWFGCSALFTGQLEPLTVGDANTYFFGEHALQGWRARWAGVSLLVSGAGAVALGASFTRFAEGHRLRHVLPWVLFGIGWLMSLRLQ